jgi:hypothetical protein
LASAAVRYSGRTLSRADVRTAMADDQAQRLGPAVPRSGGVDERSEPGGAEEVHAGQNMLDESPGWPTARAVTVNRTSARHQAAVAPL